MTPFAALHSPGGTPQPVAAARISMSRAAAPPLRTYSCDSRMPRLPPVEKLPQTRLRAAFSPGVGNSVVTFDQSHSSSSATSCAKPVSEPWPISERAIRITTVSSGRITTQALISGVPPDGAVSAATALPNGTRKPSDSPPPIAATEARNERRSREADFVAIILVVIGPPASRLCSGVNRLAHLLIGAAAADIGDRAVDVGVARIRIFLQQSGDRHDHAALAIAALRHVVVDPGLLHLVQFAIARQPLDRRDLLGPDRAYRHRAGAHRGAVDMHGAGAALRDAAPVFGAGQPDRVAQRPQERRARIDIDLINLAVDIQRNHSRHSRSAAPSAAADTVSSGSTVYVPSSQISMLLPCRLS